MRVVLRSGCWSVGSSPFIVMIAFKVEGCFVTLHEFVGDSVFKLTGLVVFILLLILVLLFSETGVVAASQSFPPNEL